MDMNKIRYSTNIDPVPNTMRYSAPAIYIQSVGIAISFTTKSTHLKTKEVVQVVRPSEKRLRRNEIKCKHTDIEDKLKERTQHDPMFSMSTKYGRCLASLTHKPSQSFCLVIIGNCLNMPCDPPITRMAITLTIVEGEQLDVVVEVEAYCCCQRLARTHRLP